MPGFENVPHLTFNGEATTCRDGATIADLLDLLQIDIRKIAIEHNRTVVPKNRFHDVMLRDGDNLEVVQFIGGG